MARKPRLKPAFERPVHFKIAPIPEATGVRGFAEQASPPLGILDAFSGTFIGSGFNTIFRPQNPATPTPLPIPAPSSNNILELNLTSETLSFSDSLGDVPNRGSVMGDVHLNGVPYLQTVSDVTDPKNPIGIHFEPGLWLAVPSTTVPTEVATLVRMASIPHGTTIEAQGADPGPVPIPGRPVIPAVDITPFTIIAHAFIRFPSQTAGTPDTPRIPQDLTPFIVAGSITQGRLDDPNSLLRDHIAAQNIESTTTITVDTKPAAPIFGGGTDNIAFLMGDAAAIAPNADAVEMTATFWVETVQETIHVPPTKAGHTVIVHGAPGIPGQKVPSFAVTSATDVVAKTPVSVTWTQIQYSQVVNLNFQALTWPHASVATLVPKNPVVVRI